MRTALLALKKLSRISAFFALLGVNLIYCLVVFADDFVPESEDDVTFSANVLTLDGDNTGGDIELKFGQALSESLQWDSSNARFGLSDNLNLGGNQLYNTRLENAVSPAVACDGTQVGRMYFNTTDLNSYVCNGTQYNPLENTLGSTVEFPAVQARRTTAYTLTTTFTDITLDTTDVENSPTIIDHDNTVRDRILINETGLYQVIYSFTPGATATATHQAFGRVRLNDTTVINGSGSQNKNYQGEFSTTSSSFIVSLNSGDFLSLQLSRDAAADSTQGDVFFSILKIEGVKGDKGDIGLTGAAGANGINGTNGADGDITWEGPWVAQNYLVNQAVEFNGSSYVCILNTVSNEDPTNPTYWELLAAKGADAPGGAGSGTDAETFILDQDDTGGDVSLQFGAALNEFLTWDNTNGRFSLSDDLRLGGNLEHSGNTLTLDADNAGAGANTSIVSEQGTDLNGEIRYNATSNQWELSNNNGAFGKMTTVYGTEFNLFQSTAVSTQNTTTFQNKINDTTTALPVGIYKIDISYNWNYDSATSGFLGRFLFDGVNLAAAYNNEMHRQEPKDTAGAFGGTGTDQKYGFSTTYYVNVTTPGTKTVQLQWAAAAGGINSSIWNANVEIIRVE